MDPKELESLVTLSDKLDAEGHADEAKALDAVLARVANQNLAKTAMSNKAIKACESLLRACESFCNKNLDTRGEHRRRLNKICDMCEDLCDELREIVGGSSE